MYRSSFRLSTRPARRRMSRWWDSVGPGISTASWISPTDISRPAFTSTKKTWRRLRCARALKAWTCVSSADNGASGDPAIVFIFPSLWKYRSRVKWYARRGLRGSANATGAGVRRVRMRHDDRRSDIGERGNEPAEESRRSGGSEQLRDDER